MSSTQKAVVLLSGGVDSTTTLALTLKSGYEAYSLTFRYGQRHAVEVETALQVARELGVRDHRVVTIDLRMFGGSALTDEVDVPRDRDVEAMSLGIPVTYVPARNTIFLSYAIAWAEVLGAADIFLGVNALDHAGYPDCRPEYIRAFEHMANLATKIGVEGRTRLTIHTPLIQMTKAEIIRMGLELGLDFSLTSSCYDPSAEGAACGHCDACILRRDGFAANGLVDPCTYRSSMSVSV
jgi:7-cyano-7-deazaguanine synthase